LKRNINISSRFFAVIWLQAAARNFSGKRKPEIKVPEKAVSQPASLPAREMDSSARRL
jgi:hypothetical protein